MKEIILKTVPIEEFLLNFAIVVSECDMRDEIFFDRQFLDQLRNIISMSSDCDKDSSYLCIEYGQLAEAQIRLKNEFQLNFYYTKLPNMFVLRQLTNNKVPYSYHDLRYPYRNFLNNSGKHYQIKISQ